MKIGLLSDTHGWIDPKIFHYFEQCDQIWHAGDIGTLPLLLLSSLETLGDFKAVYGNIDDSIIREKYPKFQKFQCEGLSIWMTHITGRPPRYTPQLRTELHQDPPNILVGGHSHVLRVIRDNSLPTLLYINPGAAGRDGFHQIRTVLRFDINNKKISNMEAIELGPRAIAIDQPQM